jgi:competence protein ComEC
MVLGGDNGIPESTTEDFRVAGLSHILAVSGQNVLLIVILVQAIATALDVSRAWRLAVPVMLICIYVPLCGAQASVVRAGVMGLAGLAAIAASRPSSRVYALIIAAVFVLAWNPRATADVGAQLSFAAVLGIMAFTHPLARRLTRLPRWIAEAFAATAGATIATAPLMAFHFQAVSIVSLAANVVGEPLIGPIVWLGSLSAAIGQVSLPLGALLNAPNEFLLGSVIEIAHTAAAIPGAQVEIGEFGGPALLIAFAPIVATAGWLNGWWRVPRRLVESWTRVSQRIFGRETLIAVAGCAAIAFAACALFFRASPSPPPRPSIVFLDVGQGDATLLLGASGCNALIDGGPPGQALATKLERLGVRRLDLVLTTHPQLDHFGGIGEIAGEIDVKTFFDGGGNTKDPAYLAVRRELVGGDARRIDAVAGSSWRCGDLSMQVVAPPARNAGAPPPADPNERAAVTIARAGPISMFASGDAESPQLLPLALSSIDVLKVPHHGSADPGLPELLRRIRPSVAVIEVGEHNTYGHPTSQVTSALAAAGVKTWRTDRDGTVLVNASSSKQFNVESFVYERW